MFELLDFPELNVQQLVTVDFVLACEKLWQVVQECLAATDMVASVNHKIFKFGDLVFCTVSWLVFRLIVAVEIIIDHIKLGHSKRL